MMLNKKYNFIFYSITNISFVIACLLLIVNICCFDTNFYNVQHKRIKINNQNINEYIGISNQELDELTVFLLDYIKDKHDSLDLKLQINKDYKEVFTNDEKEHMVDVKKLYLLVNKIMYLLFVIFFIGFIYSLFTDFNLFYKNYKKIIFITLLLFVLLGVWILIDFNSFWNLFHQIFFSNELWLLDLSEDILIMIVPPTFFNNLVVRIVYIYLVSIFGYGLILNLLSRLNKNDKHRLV